MLRAAVNCKMPGSEMEVPRKSSTLQNGDRVAIVGGGPAGSLFAIHLLREARRLDRSVEAVVIEKRAFPVPSSSAVHCRGCNFCAGIVSPRLNELLEECAIEIPEEIVQGRIDYIWVHGQWKNVRLRVPDDKKMYSVYRGSLPGRRTGSPAGFDSFLLGEAVREGAKIQYGEALKLTCGSSGVPSLAIMLPSGETTSIEASFLAIACGINPHYSSQNHADELISSIRVLNPSFVPGRSRRALIFELDVGEDFLKRHLNREIYFIEYGSKHLALEHTALIPKGRFLTVAMIGKCIDEAFFPHDRGQIIHAFLTLPQVDRILPGIAAAPLACTCTPRMSVTTATSPFGNGFALIGDAVGSRLNKDGLYSAYVTASHLAKTVLHQGTDQQSLASGYGNTVEWLRSDNRFGRTVFGISRAAFSTPLLSRVVYQAFATEYKVRDQRSRPLSSMLWKIASGMADYRDVLHEMCSYGVLRSVLVGMAVTLRNLMVELLLGIRWGEYGRYPTVVVKEKREALKQQLASVLGMELGDSPDFERMYEIKIHGLEDEIMQELANYGRPDARFVKLRFIRLRHVFGAPDQVGSVIRYTIPFAQLAAELRLTHIVGSKALLYQADEKLVQHGKLVFDITPTKDFNHRLAVYAAFDYKKGANSVSRIAWKLFRSLFPEFVHDVVWNHALCTIKEDVETKCDSTRQLRWKR
jgi:flavin-dependent dehydrogenase